MPGINMVVDFNSGLRPCEEALKAHQARLCHLHGYAAEQLIVNDRVFLGAIRYPHYPLTRLDTENVTVILEGAIYGKTADEITILLSDLADFFVTTTSTPDRKLTQWLLETDGEFVILVINPRTGDCFVFNDLLGHLPVYYFSNEHSIVIARDIRFITAYTGCTTIDRMALAQYLLFCFPLNQRTLVEKIRRLRPATLITIRSHSRLIRHETLYQFNFDDRTRQTYTLRSNAGQLAEILADACQARVRFMDNSTNVLSLSGGLDSRVVSAAMKHQNIPMIGITYLDADGNAALDAKIAKEVAAILGIDWQLMTLPQPRGRDLIELLDLKSGANYLGMAFILPFFRQLRAGFGPKLLYFSGDTGLAPRDLRPLRRVRTLDELLSQILLYDGKFYFIPIFAIDEVAKLAGVPRDDIVGELRAVVDAYPERSMAQRFAHFTFYEYALNWHYEGLDRNRAYFWVAAPLEAIPFVRAALDCPDHQKAQFRLYHKVLQRLHPGLHRLGFAPIRVPLTATAAFSIRPDRFVSMKRFVFHPIIKTILDRVPARFAQNYLAAFSQLTLSPTKSVSGLMDCLHEQYRAAPTIGEYLTVSELENHLSGYHKKVLFILMTVQAVIEDFTAVDHRRTLERYREEIMS